MPIIRLLFLSVFFSLAATVPPGAETLVWTPHAKVMEKAAEAERKVYLYFQSSQCSWCRTMEEKTLAHPDVAHYLNTHFISSRIDIDRESALARKFRVNGVPAHIFLSPEGQGLFSRPGYVPPETFLRILKILNTGNHQQ